MGKEIEWDADLPRFGKRTQNGKQSYVIQYRVGGVTRRLKIGNAAVLTITKARDLARKKLAEVELGGDPAAARAQSRRDARHTLKSTVADYLDARKPPAVRERTYTEIHRYLNQHWSPLHATPINTIVRRDVAAEITKMTSKNGAVAADHALSALSGLFAWAMGQGLVEVNPCVGVNKPHDSKPRDRVLSVDELAAIWRAAEGHYGAILRLLIATGCRKSEIGDLRRAEVDADSRTINIPAERMKAGKPHSVWLPPFAWAVLEPMVADDRDYIFGRNGRSGYGGWAKSKAALDRRLGQSIMRPWVVHDTRRGVASGMGDLGIQPHIIECILAHRSGFRAGVGGTYNRSPYEKEVRAALALWSDHVRALVERSERKVIPLRV
jgi:integrase